MKTITFKIETDEKSRDIISEDSRICSSMRRFAFNRFNDGVKQKDIYRMIVDRFDCNCHLANSALRNANALYSVNKGKKVYFGKFIRFRKGLITKDEYRESRNNGILSEGEMNQKGNRLFQIDSDGGSFVYKRNRKEHLRFKILENLKGKRKETLERIQYLMEQKMMPVTFRVKNDIVYVSYDERLVHQNERFKGLFQNRILGIDLNPDSFGISVIEFNRSDDFKVVHKEVVDVSELQNRSKNKIRHELHEIDHHIMKLCKTFRCGTISVEELKFGKRRFYSRILNRMCRNNFRFDIIKRHLLTLCNTFGVNLIEVNPAYSSIAGNFIHGGERCPDMVASSIEIARRAYRRFQKGWFKPKFVDEHRVRQVLGNQWKKELASGLTSWVGLSGIIKKSKLRYRFQLNPSNAVFSKTYVKRAVSIHRF